MSSGGVCAQIGPDFTLGFPGIYLRVNYQHREGTGVVWGAATYLAQPALSRPRVPPVRSGSRRRENLPSRALGKQEGSPPQFGPGCVSFPV